MKLGRITQLAFFALLALVAVTAHAQKHQQKQQVRPFWGSVLGEVTWGNPGVCPDQPVQTLSIANGNTLLGNTAFASSHCASSDGSLALDGVAVFTVANGDQIRATYTAKTVTPPPPLIVEQGEMIIVGGTGQFEHATGRVPFTVYVNPMSPPTGDAHWPVLFVFAGAIRY